MDTKKLKICLGLLSNRGFKGKTVMSLLKMIDYSKEHEFFFAFIDSGYTIAENRNYLSVQAFKNDCDYILMVDDDMIFPPETLEVMLSRDKDIIGLPYNVKVAPKLGDDKYRRNNVTYFPKDNEDDEISMTEPVEVMAIGGGVMLVNMNVFKKLPQPYFGFHTHDNGMTKVGEDSFFCYKASDHGFKIWVEPTLEGLGHVGDYIY